MSDRLRQMLAAPYAPLLPWAGLAMLLLAGLMMLNRYGVQGVEDRRALVESEWGKARQVMVQHREARKARDRKSTRLNSSHT